VVDRVIHIRVTAPREPRAASPKRRRRWPLVVLAVVLSIIVGGAIGARRELRTWHYKREFARAAANASACVLGPPLEVPDDVGEGNAYEALEAVRVGYLVTPTDPAHPWPARCRPFIEKALDVDEAARKADTFWSDEGYDRNAILTALDRGELLPARSLIERLWTSKDGPPDPGVPLAPKRPKAAISVNDARPFLAGAGFPTSHRMDHGDLHLVFDGIDCAISPDGKSSCNRPPREGLRPIEREPGGRAGWIRSNAVVDEGGATITKLPDGAFGSLVWARSLADGRILLGTHMDEFFESKDGKATRHPLSFDPMTTTHRWATFVDSWFVYADEQSIQAIDLARSPSVRTKIGPTTASIPNFSRTSASCVADATYLALGKLDPALMILAKGEWQYVAIEQPTLGRYVWCDAEAAVITDWMPLAIERCLDANCAPMPTAPISAKLDDELAANRTHVWQLERWNGLFTVRVWPVADPSGAKRVVLVDAKELAKKSWYMRGEPSLHVVKNRALLVFERKTNGEPIVIAVDPEAKARVVVAGE
jgi:hypothetical protein